MYIPTNNVLATLTPTVSSGLSSDLPSNITSGDYSLNYTSSSSTFVCEFTVNSNVGYVAISASNLTGSTVEVREKQSGLSAGVARFIRVSENLTRDNVLMFVFEPAFARNIRISISGGGNPTINHIAAGQAVAIPNGGVSSGYGRQWLSRGVSSRTVNSGTAAPITTLVKRSPLRVSLNLPNMPNEFVYGSWQDFSDYVSTGQVFYLTEQENFLVESPEQSYACFNPSFSAPKAHPQSRALQNLTFSCGCYNGL